MFCRFCGKSIQADSDFCPYCGKKQTTSKSELNSMQHHRERPRTSVNIFFLETIASVVFYISIIVFFVLLIKMAPGIGNQKILSYAAIATITIVISICIHKIRNKEFTVKRQTIAIIFGLMLLIPSVLLRIMYESKVDNAIAAIPSSGSVCVRLNLDEAFYSDYYEGMIREPYSFIVIDDVKYDGTTEFLIDMGKTYSIQIGAGYSGRVGVSSSSAFGTTYDSITLTPKNLKNGYKLKEQVELDKGYADVTIKLVRTCTFWEVIFA